MSQPKITTFHSRGHWPLECHVEHVGEDLLCTLSGGDRHVGAVALAQWQDERAHSECLIVGKHREKDLAVHTAHRLCRASRRSVVCVAGIHFDDLDAEDIKEVIATADALSRRAARVLSDERRRAEVEASKLHERITKGCMELAEDIDTFLRMPLHELLDRHGPVRGVDGIELFAPLYLSNACMNDCAYCGFRHSERFSRTTLDRADAIAEFQKLVGEGHVAVELVTGEVPTDAFVSYIAELCSTLRQREPGVRIGLNVGALNEKQFATLRGAGAIDARIYQETYDVNSYFENHREGPKRDMADRLQAPHHAASAGFPAVGLGVLLGLAPLASDLAGLVRHAEILLEDFPDLRLDFSLPRIRPLEKASAYRPEHEISDEAFAKAFLYLRLRFPDAELTLSTRESPELRNAFLKLGISRLSAGVSTAPGGYSADCVRGIEQFRITDGRSLEEMTEVVRRAGLDLR